MPKISIFLAHQKQIYLDDIQIAALEITRKNGGICFQLTSLKNKSKLAPLYKQLILEAQQETQNVVLKSSSAAHAQKEARTVSLWL